MKLISPIAKKKKIRHRKRPRKPMGHVDLATLPGPKPMQPEEGIEGDVSDTDDEVPSVPGPSSKSGPDAEITAKIAVTVEAESVSTVEPEKSKTALKAEK